MDGLCEKFDRLCAESTTFKMLLTLARSFDPYIPNAATTKASYTKSLVNDVSETNRPAWTRFFLQESPPKFREIFTELALSDDEVRQCWGYLSTWLRLVLYNTSIFLANITPETAHNMALGHPIAIWLFEYVDILDASCSIGMALWKRLNSNDETLLPCPALIRLPQLTIRFRTILLPVINGFHKDSWEQMKEIRKDYTQ